MNCVGGDWPNARVLDVRCWDAAFLRRLDELVRAALVGGILAAEHGADIQFRHRHHLGLAN